MGSWWDWWDVYSTRQLVYKVYLSRWKCLQTPWPWTKADAQLRPLQSWWIKCPWGWPWGSLQLRLGLLVVFNQIYLSLPIRKKHLGVKNPKTERKWKIRRYHNSYKKDPNKPENHLWNDMENEINMQYSGGGKYGDTCCYFAIIKWTHKHPNRLKAIWESCTPNSWWQAGWHPPTAGCYPCPQWLPPSPHLPHASLSPKFPTDPYKTIAEMMK